MLVCQRVPSDTDTNTPILTNLAPHGHTHVRWCPLLEGTMGRPDVRCIATYRYVYIYILLSMYIYIVRVCIYIRIYIYIYIYIYVYMCVCVCPVCVCALCVCGYAMYRYLCHCGNCGNDGHLEAQVACSDNPTEES